MRNIKLALIIFLELSLASAFSQSETAIKCGSVLNVQTGQLLSQQVILIKNQRIASIIPSSQWNEKADTVIDLSAYTVLPGLIDCHTHVLLQGDITSEDYDAQILKESIAYRTIRAVNSCRQSLLNGFTTIRDLGTEGAGYADVDLKKAIQKEEIPGPNMQVATLALNTTGHYPIKTSEYASELTMPKGVQEITGADEARRATRQQIERGADWIKIYADRGYYQLPDGKFRSLPNFTRDEIMAIGDETLRSRKKLASHAITRDGILSSIEAGASSIEHGFGMDEECMQQMAAKKIYWVPTIYVNEYVAKGRAAAGNSINLIFAKGEKALFEKALKAGVPIAYGTDIGGYDWKEPQARDFSLMVSYGMTPLQAIQTATIHAADLLGIAQSAGVIQPGFRADLIAVKGNPLENIQLLEKVNFVMKNGKVFKSPANLEPSTGKTK
ncbi:MAG: amidohydrolase family protein [Chitinophagia bacterium]|nr:amidohydrolase family protein [Chitinophagia bacterium]